MIVRYHNEQTVNDRYPRCRAGEMVGRWGPVPLQRGHEQRLEPCATLQDLDFGPSLEPATRLASGNHKALWGG